MKRRSLLGLLAAALCPTPPPGLPKAVPTGKPRMAFDPQAYMGEFRWVDASPDVPRAYMMRPGVFPAGMGEVKS